MKRPRYAKVMMENIETGERIKPLAKHIETLSPKEAKKVIKHGNAQGGRNKSPWRYILL